MLPVVTDCHSCQWSDSLLDDRAGIVPFLRTARGSFGLAASPASLGATDVEGVRIVGEASAADIALWLLD